MSLRLKLGSIVIISIALLISSLANAQSQYTSLDSASIDGFYINYHWSRPAGVRGFGRLQVKLKGGNWQFHREARFTADTGSNSVPILSHMIDGTLDTVQLRFALPAWNIGYYGPTITVVNPNPNPVYQPPTLDSASLDGRSLRAYSRRDPATSGLLISEVNMGNGWIDLWSSDIKLWEVPFDTSIDTVLVRVRELHSDMVSNELMVINSAPFVVPSVVQIDSVKLTGRDLYCTSGSRGYGSPRVQFKLNGSVTWENLSSRGFILPSQVQGSHERMDTIEVRVHFRHSHSSYYSNTLTVVNDGFYSYYPIPPTLTLISLTNNNVSFAWSGAFLGRGRLEYKPKGGSNWRIVPGTLTTNGFNSGVQNLPNSLLPGESLDSVHFRTAYYRNSTLLTTSQEVYVENVGASAKMTPEFIDEVSSFTMFPNPCRDKLIIKDAQRSTVSIWDGYGKLIFSDEIESNEKEINTTNLASGIYFVKIKWENKLQVSRLVKD